MRRFVIAAAAVGVAIISAPVSALDAQVEAFLAESRARGFRTPSEDEIKRALAETKQQSPMWDELARKAASNERRYRKQQPAQQALPGGGAGANSPKVVEPQPPVPVLHQDMKGLADLLRERSRASR